MPAASQKTFISFTEPRLRDWPLPPSGRIRLKDHGNRESVPGLCLYVTPRGKVFYFYGKDKAGRPRDVRLGTWPAMTIEKARERAKDVSLDPGAVAEEKRAILKESTLAELWDWFKLHHLSRLRPKTVRLYEDAWRLHIAPELGTKRLSAIKKRDVQAMVDGIELAGAPRKTKEGRPIRKTGGRAAARHAAAMLSAMFHAAAKDEAFAFKADIPTVGIIRPKVPSRARFLQPGELPAFLAALAEEPPIWRLFWTCCLFVGLRRGNVAAARWEDIALDLGQWLVPEERSKTDALLAIPIPANVLAPLREWKAKLPALLEEANEARRRLLTRGDANCRDRQPLMSEAELLESSRYVFPSALVLGKPSEHPHITDPKASWRRVLIRAKLSNLRPHDLRRSIGSWMALGGVGLPIIGAALGHKDAKSTMVYARLNDGAVRAAMERATCAMLATAEEVKP